MRESKDGRLRVMTAVEVAQRYPSRPPDASPRTFLQAWAAFWSRLSPWLILAWALIFIVWRFSLGPLAWSDLMAAATVIALFPFIEWGVHTGVLHSRWLRLLGHEIDFYLPRTHRIHHADPWNLRWVFIPKRVYLFVPVLFAVLLWLFWPWKPTVATSIAVYMLLGLHYEWVHFLAHIPWSPPLSYWRRRVREHRQHHFRNEGYWWGVSMGLGDRVLKTAPAVTETPRSDTARTLN